MRNWENIRFYLAVANTGSATRAAAELRVSHTTVLRRIEQIESELDTKLFKRLQSGYELTAAGEKLLDDAKGVEKEIQQMEIKFHGQGKSTAGKLRISQPESDVLHMYPIYADFARQHPEITLEIHSTFDAADLNRQEADVVIRLSENPPDLLVGRPVGKIGYGLYGNSQYLKQFGNGFHPDLYDWIIWQMQPDGIQMRWLKTQVENPKIVLYTSSMSDVIGSIRAGMGVGFVSNHVAKQYPDLEVIPEAEVVGLFPIWILTHGDLRKSERVKVFMQFVGDRLKEELKINTKRSMTIEHDLLIQ